ncbi:MAG: glycosyltransferase [Clostridia bacterium]|nr:glycosyltransferase [Clostridia bacterium]
MSRHFKKIKNIILHKGYDKKEIKRIKEDIEKNKKANVLAIYNPECIGIMNSTKDLFEHNVAIGEIFSKRAITEIAECIVKSNVSQVMFASIALGWKELAEEIKLRNKDIKIKFSWHGSHAMLVQRNETYFLYNILELLDRKIADSVAFVKESMAEFYKQKGYNSYFLPNTLKDLKVAENTVNIKEKGKINIGLYSAGNRWEKNTFNQLSAISMIENAVVDILPVTDLVKEFANMMNINIKDESLGYLKREELLARMKQNDVNLYVTFTECSPVTPLESLELGVPCITGNNHHYFRDSKLEEYLVVQAEDDINEINQKIKIALENKEEIIKLYKSWKKDYDKYVSTCLKDFIES